MGIVAGKGESSYSKLDECSAREILSDGESIVGVFDVKATAVRGHGDQAWRAVKSCARNLKGAAVKIESDAGSAEAGIGAHGDFTSAKNRPARVRVRPVERPDAGAHLDDFAGAAKQSGIFGILIVVTHCQRLTADVDVAAAAEAAQRRIESIDVQAIIDVYIDVCFFQSVWIGQLQHARLDACNPRICVGASEYDSAASLYQDSEGAGDGRVDRLGSAFGGDSGIRGEAEAAALQRDGAGLEI